MDTLERMVKECIPEERTLAKTGRGISKCWGCWEKSGVLGDKKEPMSMSEVE